MIIGICGGSGSGKTTLLKRLAAFYGELHPTVFSMDNYYLPIEQQLLDENGQVNFDLPTALDRDRLVKDLRDLKEGKSIEVKEYHFNAPPNKNVLITLDPSPIIIVEGLFLFEYAEVYELLDFSIFMDVDPEIQLDRRLYRDQETRGYSRAAIMYQWKYHVMPCYQKYLFPYMHLADFIFENDQQADLEFERLIQMLAPKLLCLKE
ncbi:uridine kinase family protein [Fluviicola sp.]|uniref:uridine kinase family protein n=1 Tax=Fluviicola sp. TaxID=1917219 RepID=UPI003D278837